MSLDQCQALLSIMPPEYMETHFAGDSAVHDWAQAFAIITAYATTGQCWSAAENKQADRNLQVFLDTHGLESYRISGYSPTTGHAEPGWAVAVELAEACAIGLHFKQDAIYYVDCGNLFVSYCDERRRLIFVDQFIRRLHFERFSQS